MSRRTPVPIDLGVDTKPTPEPVSTRALLISIQPRHAEAILDGRKEIELRRTMPTLTPGALALIYASTPVRAIVGWASITEILYGAPSSVWRGHRQETAVTSAEFRKYFAGATTAYGLRLSGVTVADHQMSLARLRTYDLEPPQSWRYIDASLAHDLRDAMRTSAVAAGRDRRRNVAYRLAGAFTGVAHDLVDSLSPHTD